jgi:hypothetical protein
MKTMNPGLIALQPVTYARKPNGDLPSIHLPAHAADELFGASMQPGSISTLVVIEEVGDAAEGGSLSEGGALLSTASGPFNASLTRYPNTRYSNAQLMCPPLQRAVVGLVRMGVRRADARTIALVLASPAHAARVAQAQACGLLVPLPPITYQRMPCGKPSDITVPQAAAMALFGLEPGAFPPATLTTAVVLEVEGGVGPGGPPSRRPFHAIVTAKRSSEPTRAAQPKLVCAALQRAVVGWQRVGMRRVDADTVALVLASLGSQKAQGGQGRR